MRAKINYYIQIIDLLNELHRTFPTYNLGKHLSTALDGQGDVWGISDKELLYILTKYKTELELDTHHANDKEIEDIIRDGMNLNDILMEEEDNGESY
jgi:hypothetical protein